MAWLDFLKNGNELSELLIEGQNPYGAHLLQPADVAQLRKHVPAQERVVAYVLGRVARAGRGLWLLTDQHVLVSEHARGDRVLCVKLSDISHAECVQGKYGVTLRITAARQLRSVYGAAPHLAAVFYRALGQQVNCAPATKPHTLNADEVAEVVHHFTDAALQLQPMGLANAHALAQISNLAQEAAQQGWLLPSEVQSSCPA